MSYLHNKYTWPHSCTYTVAVEPKCFYLFKHTYLPQTRITNSINDIENAIMKADNIRLNVELIAYFPLSANSANVVDEKAITSNCMMYFRPFPIFF
jgi:hypothetical protein